MELLEKVMKVQSELVATKGQYNSFGKYKYRSAEDIVEAVKPLLKKYGLVMVMKDEIVNVGERYYIKAVVELTCVESGKTIEATGYAREEENKKGMDGSQITGASSSYARKYAMNGMFAIDDSKDSDYKTSDYGGEVKKTKKPSNTKKEEPKNENKNIQTAITSLFSELVGEFGSNEVVYENIGVDRDTFVKLYKEYPAKLWEALQQYA